MASVTKNSAKVRRTAHGASLVVNDGTDDITIDNITPGSYVITPPYTEEVNWKKADKPQAPLQGDYTVPSIEFNAIAGAMTGTQELLTLATANSASSNVKKTYTTATFKQPDYPGAATGESVVMTGPWFSPGPQYKGGDPNTIEGLKLCCVAASWAAATY